MSFLVANLPVTPVWVKKEYLYDLEIDVREILEEPDVQYTGVPHPLWNMPKVIFAEQWDDDAGFAALLADLSEEALAEKGDLIRVK